MLFYYQKQIEYHDFVWNKRKLIERKNFVFFKQFSKILQK